MKPATQTVRIAAGECYDFPPCTVLLRAEAEGDHLAIEWREGPPRYRDGWVDVSFRVVKPDTALLPRIDAMLDKAEAAGLRVDEVQVTIRQVLPLALELARVAIDPVGRGYRREPDLADEIRTGKLYYRGVRLSESPWLPIDASPQLVMKVPA